MKSVATSQEAIKLISNLEGLVNKGGFHFKDWVSNNEDVINSISEHDRAQFKEQDLDMQNEPTKRVLGIVWSVVQDTFEFKVNIEDA